MRASPDLRYEAAQDLSGFDLAELARRALAGVRRNWALILGSCLIFALLGALLALKQAPYYAARSSIIIDPRVSEGMNASEVPTILMADALVVDSEVEVLSSEQILSRVMERLDLMNLTRQSIAEAGEEVPDDAALRESVLAWLGKNLDIVREGKTFVVRINATAASPEMAANLANAIADEYLMAQLSTQANQARQTSDWLQEQLKLMGKRVMEAEDAVERYVFDNDVPEEDARNAVSDELAEADAQLIAARAEIRTASADIGTIDRATGRTTGEPSSITMQSQLVTALGGREGLRKTQIEDELARLRDERQARIDLATSQSDALAKKTAELKAELSEISSKQIRLRELRREATALQTQYETMLATFQQTEGEGRFFRSNARVIERALPPTEPSNQSLPVMAIAAGIGGLIMGLGLALIREQLDDSIRRSDDVFEQLGLPYLGAMPRLSNRELQHLPPSLARRAQLLKPAQQREVARLTYVASAPFSLMAETFRRTMFELKSRHPNGRHTVAAVSAVSGEGKSFYASNLAFFLARQGYRVVLIDGDIRNPHLSRSLGPLVEDNEPAGAVTGVSALTENLLFVHMRNVDHLRDAERQMDSLVEVLAQCGEQVDFVILDTPPLGYVSDGLSLSALVDSAVLVVDWGRTSSSALRRVLRQNEPITRKLIGACLSKAKVSMLQQYESVSMTNNYYRSGPENRRDDERRS